MKDLNKVRDMKNVEIKRIVLFETAENAMEFSDSLGFPVTINRANETIRDLFGCNWSVCFRMNNDEMRSMVEKYGLVNNVRRSSKAINRTYWFCKKIED